MRTPGRFKRRHFTGALCSALGVGAAVLSSNAQVTLTEGNAVVNINPASQAGMYNWFVDGQDYLAQQWLWYRVGTSGGEYSIDTLSLSSVNQPLPDQVTLNYTHPTLGFDLQVTYALTGGSIGSGASDVAESIQVFNHSGGSLDFHLFLYSDLDLNGTAAGDTVTSVDWVAVAPPFGPKGYERATQVEGLDVNQTTLGTWANRAEAQPFNVTLGKLNNALPDNLLNTGATFGPNGPGDMTYAFQWDLAIGNGTSKTITVDKRLDIVPIPEPSSLALSLAGLAGLFRATMRRRI